MHIEDFSLKDFIALDAGAIAERVAAGDAYLVRGAASPEAVMALRAAVCDLAARNSVGWQKVDDDCPNYHRVIDEHPQSYVMQKCQRSAFHLWRPESRGIAEIAIEAYRLKARLAGRDDLDFMYTPPSSGAYCQVGVNHYPRGGGYMRAHTDPIQSYQEVHTIFSGSKRGEDYETGGLFLVDGDAKVAIDDLWSAGDMLCFDAGVIVHGVDEVDADRPLDWSLTAGRYTFSPVAVQAKPGTAPVGSTQRTVTAS